MDHRVTWGNEEDENWNGDMRNLVERKKTWRREKTREWKWTQEMHQTLPALKKADMELFTFEKNVKEKEESFKGLPFSQAFKARLDLQKEVSPERQRLQAEQRSAQWVWEDPKAKMDRLRHGEGIIKFMEVELRERWARIHRIRDNDYKRFGISRDPKKSRRAEKKEIRDAVYAAEQRFRLSKEFY
jgi:hypothetical protein